MLPSELSELLANYIQPEAIYMRSHEWIDLLAMAKASGEEHFILTKPHLEFEGVLVYLVSASNHPAVKII